MSWKPVIVAVNGSEESVRAACAAGMIARRAGVACIPVYIAPDYSSLMNAYGQVPIDDWMADRAIEEDRRHIATTLHGCLPPDVIQSLEVRTGRPSLQLKAIARERGAGLIALGARQHRGLERIGRDTIRHLVRTCEVPLLVTNGGRLSISRVLAAVDSSSAARQTIETASRWAELCEASLRVLHAVEPPPDRPGGHAQRETMVQRECEDRLVELAIRSMTSRTGIDLVIRRGSPAQLIRREVTRWKADLLVVGAHGRGFVDRLLIGSTTERLLRRIPSMMLVLPAGRLSDQRPLQVESLPWEERAEAGVG